MHEIKVGYGVPCRSRRGALNRIVHGRLVFVAPDPAHPAGAALCVTDRVAPGPVGKTVLQAQIWLDRRHG